ncbi:Fanconi anemia group D2 protein homolog [Condylostylus longicornis]|uniref:Fanconi anemia group D2 protein homolog n=1 Tax=Condylostylus longicornis TaxID=2530218 RepID=UPI00244E23FA|nr:Fanconi anemia group D2 protein homolog [Condylostylus longicornis]
MYKNKRSKKTLNAIAFPNKRTRNEKNLKPIKENEILNNSQKENASQISSTQQSNEPPAKNSRIEISNQIEIHRYSNDIPHINKQGDEDVDLLGSQESVPASQPPTQRRYLSQRGFSMTLNRTQSKSSRAPDSYFEMVLIKTGVEIENSENFILTCDPLSYVNNLASLLKKHHEFPDNIQTFLDGYKEYLNNQFRQLKLLTGCVINISSMGTEYQSQDSMTMNFMMIDFLQEGIIDILFQKIEKCASENQNFSPDVPVLPLLLSQLKFVTTVCSDKLYDRIIKIYEKATAQSRREIISSAEYILDASKHDEFVQYLIDNTNSLEDLLSTENVKAFANLYLTSTIQKNIRKKIILYVKNGCNISRLAVFMKFLLKFLQDDEENLSELVSDIRTALDWHESNINEFEILKYQSEIFTYIKQGLIRSKKLCDIWQKSIQNLNEESTKPVDIIIFLMLMSIRDEKGFYIENLIRRQVKLEHIKLNVVSETKRYFSPMLDTYGDVFLQVLYNFVKEKTHIVSEFAKNCFCIIFSVNENYQKKILNKLVDLACNKYSKNITTTALDVLYILNERFNKEVQNFGSLLMPMLDQINEIPLKQIRKVMQLMCSIAYPLPPLTGSPHLQEHIEMMIKKQICSRNVIVQKKGIIGIVQLINFIVRTELSDDSNIYDINESYQTANDLPEGRGKQAASFVLRVFSATNYCTNSLGLFYEELAIALSTKNLENNKAKIERHFLVWLCDLVTYYLQENFIEEIDKEMEYQKDCELETSVQRCQNFAEDLVTETDALNLAINIARPVFVPSIEAHSSILILPPLFNLIAVVQKIKFSESLEAINAVLGCGIILPKIFQDEPNFQFWHRYKEETVIKVIDMHFHTVNWYRVIVSSFISQDSELLRKKILFRLKELIEFEELTRKCLTQTSPNYFPPLSLFNNFEEPKPSKATRGKKTEKKNVKSTSSNKGLGKRKVVQTETEVTENEGMSMIAATHSQDMTINRATKLGNKNVVKLSQFEFSYGPKEIFRQLDNDIILILREDFDLTYPLEESKIGFCLGLKELKYIMQDLVSKIESIPGIKKLGNDVIVQNMCHIKCFMEKSEIYLSHIYKNLETMKKFLFELLIKVNGSLGNSALFTDQVNYIKICFSLCVRFIASYFSFSGFDDLAYAENLKRALQSISNKKSNNINELVSNVIEQLMTLEPAVVEIKAAFYLYHAINTIQRFSSKTNFEKKIRIMCKVFLCRRWYNLEGNMEKGAFSNILLDEIIKGFVKNSSSKRLKEILVVILTDSKGLKGKDDIIKSFPNIHKGNFPMLFRRLCESLIESTNTSISRNHSEMESLKTWEDLCNNLNILLDIIQSTDIPRNYSLYIKYSHSFIKVFLDSGLPSFEKSLRKNPERFNTLLKNLQYNTRFLHNLCCHSKAIKNNAIVAQIPFVRETVEKLLYKVQATLAANKCVSAFWMGPLKNKDIQGEEISLSQPSAIDIINKKSKNNEECNDDSSADDTIMDDDAGSVAKKTNKNQSLSDCF